MTTQTEPAQTLHWYFTASLPMHNNPIYNQTVQNILSNLPYISPGSDNLIVQAKGLYRNAQDWLIRWPHDIFLLVNGGGFFILDNGWIGKGVHTEIQDILNKSLPVYLISEGKYYPIPSLTGDAFAEGPDYKWYTHIDVKRISSLISSVTTGDDIIRRAKEVIENYLRHNHDRYPTKLDDILPEMRLSTRLPFNRKSAVETAHRAIALVQEERSDTEPRLLFVDPDPVLEEEYKDEEDAPDDTPQPNNYLYGNPYR